jgi:agmatinase
MKISSTPILSARRRLDAHADLRDSYGGNPLSHACVMRRVLDMDCKTLGVGMRSMSDGEAVFIRERGIDVVGARQVLDGNDWYVLLDKLPERIYVTVDVDFFDPADAPAVGTPEPGGPSWEQAVAFLAHLNSVKNVVAADVVELMPGKDDEATVRLAARLVGLLVGLKFQD